MPKVDASSGRYVREFSRRHKRWIGRFLSLRRGKGDKDGTREPSHDADPYPAHRQALYYSFGSKLVGPSVACWSAKT